jgi:hypothetical protein
MTKRDKKIEIRLSEEEYNNLKDYVKNNNLSTVAGFVRKVALMKIRNGFEVNGNAEVISIIKKHDEQHDDQIRTLKALHETEIEKLKKENLQLKQQTKIPSKINELGNFGEIVDKINKAIDEHEEKSVSPISTEELVKLTGIDKATLFDVLTNSKLFAKKGRGWIKYE